MFNVGMPSIDDIVVDSPNCCWHRASGEALFKTVSITGTGGEVITNCFSFGNLIEIIALYGVLTDATDVTQLDGIWLDVYDGTNSVALTADGASLSGATEHSAFEKIQDDSQALTVGNASQVRYVESAFRRAFAGGLALPKNGVTNYIRLRCDTDANTDAVIVVGLVYVCRYQFGGGVVVV